MKIDFLRPFAILALFGSILSPAVQGLGIRHDQSEEQHRELARGFPSVVFVARGGTGILVGSRWVLTAAHVTDFFPVLQPDPAKRTVTLEGRSYPIAEVHLPPGRKPLSLDVLTGGADPSATNLHDLALLELAEPVEEHTPIPLYTGSEELGQEFTLIGYGAFIGDGRRGKPIAKAMRMPRGIRRAGTNRFARVDDEKETLEATFDDPALGNATDLESSAMPGDSGGPLLIRVGKTWQIAGICSALDSGDDDIIGNYGDTIVATRVSRYTNWIRKTITEENSEKN